MEAIRARCCPVKSLTVKDLDGTNATTHSKTLFAIKNDGVPATDNSAQNTKLFKFDK